MSEGCINPIQVPPLAAFEISFSPVRLKENTCRVYEYGMFWQGRCVNMKNILGLFKSTPRVLACDEKSEEILTSAVSLK